MRILRRVSQTLTLAAVILTAAVVVVSTTLAATVSSANDYPSTLQTSQASNHKVLFTTPTGVLEGETITVQFASAFDTSSLTEDDIDVADDGVDLTTAGTCAGSEQASVSIASDIVTITICAGDGGAMAATSVVTVEIGTNATSSGTGANQVTNPPNAGAYFISIGGTFADSGSIVLPIGGDDSIGVTATVPSSGGGGGGGGETVPATSDTTAPVISGIVVSGITTSTATVSWSTDEAAVSSVLYWVTGSSSSSSATRSGYYTAHAISLSGLTEGTSYSFTVTSTDSSGNTSTSSVQTFTTLDATAPVISSVVVTDITTTSARVTWTTNELADSLVYYGETASYGSSGSSATLELSHSVLLTELNAGTSYHYQVLSTDASSNQASSSDGTFETDADDAPGNVAGLSVSEGDTQLILSWTNPTDSDLAGIRVVRCLTGYPTGPTDSACTVVSTSLTTSLTQTGLTNGTPYYFGVFAYDTAGQFASGALVMGTPQASEEEVPSDEGTDGEAIDDSTEPEPSTDTSTEEDEEEDTATDTTPTDSAVSCGDAVCSESESSESCPEDCGETEEPTSLGTEAGVLSDTDLIYLVADESITLTVARSGVVDVLPTSTMRIAIPESSLSDGVSTIILTVGSDTYLMRLDDALALYIADFTIPNVQTILQVSVLVTYENGVTDTVSSYLNVVAQGNISQVIDGEEAVVSSASVTLFQEVGNEMIVWDGSPWSQFNPTSVTTDGSFAWYVQNGTYLVSASSDGFNSANSAKLTISNFIVNPRILLTLVKQEEEEVGVIEETPAEELAGVQTEDQASISESFIQSLPIQVVQETLDLIRDLPGVEKTAEISTPALAISAGVSVVVLSVAFDFLPFLQYLFTAPILFLWRRRRKGYGIVYNAISKTPVDLAVVRLFRIESQDEATGAHGRLVKSRVTDKGGRYYFLVPPGTYRIQVSKPGFTFPSDYLKDETTDGAYLDVYHGESLEVASDGVVVTANIPLDPSQAEKYQAPKAIQQRKILRALQHGIAVVGFIGAVVFAIIRPNLFSILMVGIQALMYFVVRRLAKPHRPISWGIVYSKETGRPLSRVVARIFEPKYNKLLETQVTDSKGRYAFMLGPNQYFATFQKQGYKTNQIDPIDYSLAKEPKGFAEEVPLVSEETSN
ncbi:fibronectin type III domain-containing protein [Candidatus Uhrbacteria bacterium]|nr:fibronectin type III domain-containing protein [Candidatus Uhrbacteria bacterium]